MHHREIYQAVSAFLAEHWATQPFKLLDLGCGDSSFIAQALHDKNIQHYLGFDLSDTALEIAAENIALLGCKTDLINIDFMAGLAQTTEGFDVVFTSYALHHLNQKEKAEFFRLAYKALTGNGILIIVDVMREPDESLSAHLNNYCLWVRNEWRQFNEQELTAIIQHISHNDMPETEAQLLAMAEAEGFCSASCLFQVSRHQALVFSKK